MTLKHSYEYLVTTYLFGFICLIPANTRAAPDLAQATARISANVLASVSLAIEAASDHHPAQLRISDAGSQTFQLQIGRQSQHSFQSSHFGVHNFPPTSTSNKPNQTPNGTQALPVTLYFN